jgi:hypothetical protein
MNRHPDNHKAMGQVLQDARDAFGQPRDLPSRDDRFALVPEDDDGLLWQVFGIVVAGCAAAGAIIYAFNQFIVGGV